MSSPLTVSSKTTPSSGRLEAQGCQIPLYLSCKHRCFTLVKGVFLQLALGKTEISTPSASWGGNAIVRSLARMQNCANLSFESTGSLLSGPQFLLEVKAGDNEESLILVQVLISPARLKPLRGRAVSYTGGSPWHLAVV